LRACSAAEDTKTAAKVAIKKVGRVFKDLTDAKRIVREIKLMRHFDHENVRGLCLDWRIMRDCEGDGANEAMLL
jgi:hypothetical protein